MHGALEHIYIKGKWSARGMFKKSYFASKKEYVGINISTYYVGQGPGPWPQMSRISNDIVC